MSIKAIIYCDTIASNHAIDLEATLTNLSNFLLFNQQKFPKEPKTILIAVDSGANILYRNGVTPEIVIGDMDSIDPEVLAYYRQRTTVEIFPVHKDQTDTELALDWCFENNIRKVLIINSLQGEFAHALGIVALLFKARNNGVDATIYNGREQVFLLPREWSYRGKVGKKISLVPLTPSVEGVETSGLQYPLHEEVLFWHSTRGLSNVFIDAEIKICYRNGELLGVMESSIEEIL